METIVSAIVLIPVVASDPANLRPALAAYGSATSLNFAASPSDVHNVMLKATTAAFAAFLVLPDQVAFVGVLLCAAVFIAVERYAYKRARSSAP